MADVLETVHDKESDFRPVSGPLSGGDMMDEVLRRKFERTDGGGGSEKPGATPAASEPKEKSTDHSSEIAKLQAQIDAANKSNQELRGLYERSQGQYQTLISQRQEQRQPAVELPAYPELADPDLLAAINTLEKRMDHKLGQYNSQIEQRQIQETRRSEYQRYQQALADIQSEFPGFASEAGHRQAVDQFASQFYNDPRWAGLNWKHELRNAARATVGYENVVAERDELKKKLEGYEKRQTSDRQKQKENLKMVPAVGRSGGAGGGRQSVGESILSDAKAKGRKLTWSEFGSEFRRRRAAQA